MYWIRLTPCGLTPAFFYVLLFIRPANGPLAVTLMVLCMLLPGCGEAYADQRRRRDWYARRFASVDELRSVVADEVHADLRGRREKRESYVRAFGSVDELRQVIDGPGLRRIRDEDGPIAAVRELRSRHPGLPLDMAVTLLKGL
ncbi:hypothetical protein AB0C61_22960 [Streptomyces sp. NPDC048680]|uniref:hypothetical protein n=1 Tax=Streptomyces sp. NPDC048680 TaxID=3155492 RepID=UPI003423D4FC